jgi:hypothetical protein
MTAKAIVATTPEPTFCEWWPCFICGSVSLCGHRESELIHWMNHVRPRLVICIQINCHSKATIECSDCWQPICQDHAFRVGPDIVCASCKEARRRKITPLAMSTEVRPRA